MSIFARIARRLPGRSGALAGVPAGLAAPRSRRATVLLALAAAAALLPLLVTPFPPLYDYYHWLYQGHIVASFLHETPESAELAAAYQLRWRPIPNLAAPVMLGLLESVLRADRAGRLLLAIAVLGFSAAAAALARCAQGRATVLELLGLPFAYGYFLYKGYLSYLLALSLALAVLGLLHRRELGDERRQDASSLLALSALGMLTYLCHLMGWAVLAAATLVYAARRARRGQRGPAKALLLTLVPTALLLAVYLLGRPGTPLEVYSSLAGKARSLLSPLLLVLRKDPFVPMLPSFWINLLGLGLIAAVILGNIDWRSGRSPSRPLLAVAGLLALIAVLMPFSEAGGLGRPDERLVLPALAAAAAALPLLPLTPRRAAVPAVLVAALIGFHAVEYDRIGGKLEAIARVTAAAIPDGARVASISIQRSQVDGACGPDSGITLGAPFLKWFDLVRLIDDDGVGANLMGTSFVQGRHDPKTPVDLLVLSMSPAQAEEWFRTNPRLEFHYPVVEVFGCPVDIARTRAALRPRYLVAAEGDGFAVLRADL